MSDNKDNEQLDEFQEKKHKDLTPEQMEAMRQILDQFYDGMKKIDEEIAKLKAQGLLDEDF